MMERALVVGITATCFATFLLFATAVVAYQRGYDRAHLACMAHLDEQACYQPLHDLMTGAFDRRDTSTMDAP